MTSQPYISVRIELCDVMIQLLGCLVIVTPLAQILDQAGRVAGVGRSLTVAYLLPEILTTLSATTASEEIIVELVVARCICAVKNSGCWASIVSIIIIMSR